MGVYVEPNTPEVAGKLIAIANAKGISPKTIKTEGNGFSVPSAVAEEYRKRTTPAPAAEAAPAKKATPRKRAAKKAVAEEPPEESPAEETASADLPESTQE